MEKNTLQTEFMEFVANCKLVGDYKSAIEKLDKTLELIDSLMTDKKNDEDEEFMDAMAKTYSFINIRKLTLEHEMLVTQLKINEFSLKEATAE